MDSFLGFGQADPIPVQRTIFWVAMAVWGVLEVRTSIVRRGTDTGEDEGSQRWSFAGVFGSLLVALLIDGVTPEVVSPAGHAPFLLVGATFVAGGVALRIWSIRTLGRFFTYQVMTTADQTVVKNGPYRLLRHPSYTALLICAIGAGIATANPWALLVTIVMPIVGLARRIRVEEAALERALGTDYAQFIATRKRLIPGVW